MWIFIMRYEWATVEMPFQDSEKKTKSLRVPGVITRYGRAEMFLSQSKRAI